MTRTPVPPASQVLPRKADMHIGQNGQRLIKGREYRNIVYFRISRSTIFQASGSGRAVATESARDWLNMWADDADTAEKATSVEPPRFTQMTSFSIEVVEEYNELGKCQMTTTHQTTLEAIPAPYSDPRTLELYSIDPIGTLLQMCRLHETERSVEEPYPARSGRQVLRTITYYIRYKHIEYVQGAREGGVMDSGKTPLQTF